DYRAEIHDRERGRGSFAKAMEGLRWLASQDVTVEVAGRYLSGDAEDQLRAGFARVLHAHGVTVDTRDPRQLVLFPEMSPQADPEEITSACWGILNVSPNSAMCSSARMVVKRQGALHPIVLACTLIAYDKRFELGVTLAEASDPVYLAHRHCSTFCVLGGAA